MSLQEAGRASDIVSELTWDNGKMASIGKEGGEAAGTNLFLGCARA